MPPTPKMPRSRQPHRPSVAEEHDRCHCTVIGPEVPSLVKPSLAKSRN